MYNTRCKSKMVYTFGFFMGKDFSLVKLYELYNGLLTEKQRQLFSAFYLYDLSFSEIALQEGTSRQSVSNALRQVKNKLCEYESQLKLSEKFEGVIKVANSLTESNNPLGEKLMEILEK